MEEEVRGIAAAIEGCAVQGTMALRLLGQCAIRTMAAIRKMEQRMRTVMVRYKVKPDAAAENERLIGQMFAQLARDKPAGVRYNVFKLPDSVFVHVGSSEAGGAEGNPLVKLEAFKAFTAGIKDRAEEPPVTVEMQQLGFYDGMG